MFLIHVRGSFYGTLKCHKIEAKVGYCIRIPALIIINNCCKYMIEDCLKMFLPTDDYALLCEVASCSLWAESVAQLFLICL